MKYITPKVFLIALGILGLAVAAPAGPTPADVGDAESFGHAALYMGAASGFVQLAPTCSPTPAPVPPATANDSQCFALDPTPGSTTVFDAQDICRIKLPKKATRTIIYPALNFFVNYQLSNPAPNPRQDGEFKFNATLTIESDALLGVNDPSSGLPLNGKLTGQFSYAYRDDRSMDTGDRQRQRMTLVRVGNAGINKAALIGQGFSASVVDNLFNSAITIRMSISGTAQLTTDATITGNMRLFGD